MQSENWVWNLCDFKVAKILNSFYKNLFSIKEEIGLPSYEILQKYISTKHLFAKSIFTWTWIRLSRWRGSMSINANGKWNF